MRELAERCVSTVMLWLILTDFRVLYFDMSVAGRVLSTTVAMVLFGFLEYLVHKNLHNDITKAPHHKDHHNKPNSLVIQIVAFEAVLAWFAGLWALKMIGIISGHFAAQILGTYLLYEVFHTVTHAHPETMPKATEWHTARHHKAPKKNFGVTTRGWDRAFGTQYEDKTEHDDHVQRVFDFIPVYGFALEALVDYLDERHEDAAGKAKKEDPPPLTRTEPLQMATLPEN